MSIKSLGFGLLAFVVACSGERNVDDAGNGRAANVTSSRAAPGDSAPRDTTLQKSKKVTVLFFGTSLTAGYGLDPSIAFPNLIAKKSLSTDTPIQAINAGLSGETSAGAVRRIAWVLKRPADIVVIETGGNDALRALDPDSLEANLESIVTTAKRLQPKARILLVAMESPPNLGASYNAKFRQAYVTVSQREHVTLVPFLLDKVAGKTELNQADGVHPNEKGEPIVADNIWRALQPTVKAIYEAR